MSLHCTDADDYAGALETLTHSGMSAERARALLDKLKSTHMTRAQALDLAIDTLDENGLLSADERRRFEESKKQDEARWDVVRSFGLTREQAEDISGSKFDDPEEYRACCFVTNATARSLLMDVHANEHPAHMKSTNALLPPGGTHALCPAASWVRVHTPAQPKVADVSFATEVGGVYDVYDDEGAGDALRVLQRAGGHEGDGALTP